MRLWHYKLIPYLPKSQLLAQWRELNSIYVNQPRHILINYVYNYPKEYLMNYSQIVINEMNKRGYKISNRAKSNYESYFGDTMENYIIIDKVYPEHNEEYLRICCYNLYEKYIRGQEDLQKIYGRK